MKNLLILLFLFSINSFSGEIDGKVLICVDQEKYINKDISRSDYIFGYIFENGSANYYYNAVMENGMFQIRNVFNVRYNVNSKFIVLKLEYGSLFINRKTLEHTYNNNITASCEVAKSKNFFFSLLNERRRKLNRELEKNK